MIETGDYRDFTASLEPEFYARQLPVNGTIEISHRCPLECAHCYNNLPMKDGSARRTELTLDEHKRIIDELVDMGMLWLLYTGGEIFARPDFLDIYRYAHSKGIFVTLFTNGTMITERIADALAAAPPFEIEITLYGRTKAIYESVTGVPGSFERCLRGIDLLLERNLPLKLKTVGLTINKHEVKAMKKFAEEKGVDFKFDALLNPRIDCSASPLAVRLTPLEVVALDFGEPVRISEWRRIGIEFAAAEPSDVESAQVYDCGGGVNTFAIDPYGKLSICVLSKVDMYDLRQGTVREGWEEFLRKVRAKKVTRVTKCTTCSLKSLCGSCAATGELENGDPEAPVDFLCQTAHLRARLWDVPMRQHGDCEYCEGGAERHRIEQWAAELTSRNADQILEIMEMPPDAIPASGCGPATCGSCSLH